MAHYTAEFLASLRRRYEETDQPMSSLAAEFEIGLRTLHRMVEREGWNKRSDAPPRELPAAIRLLDEANTLLTESAAPPIPTVAEGGTLSAPPGTGEGLSAADRIEWLVVKEIEVEEAKRAQLGALPRAATEAAQTARTLAILTHTLHALQRLRFAQPGTEYDHHDAPRDIDEFRRKLARRIDAFVASRTDAGNAAGNPEPRLVEETR
jgi:hypothetical protein